ncbi:MAG TPA: hypothetical protein ENN92_00630 [candidate division WWE3 bacterium]|uniref:Thioredoxin domain-containing protein n=1 Tax=candidate division WWE3 bacterium TaxID=2053526 RepID=A0A7C1DJN7_UNCKA|nr:hypothetical protein [candidate division WWE3 bacterium]
MKKIFLRLFSVAFAFLLVNGLYATPAFADSPINAYFFWGEGCPHCAQEEAFLEGLQKEYSNLKIHSFEIYKNRKNALLLQKVGRALSTDVSGVPFLVIGDIAFAGYSPNITAPKIRSQVEECFLNTCSDPVASLLEVTPEEPPLERSKNSDSSEHSINVSIIGLVNLDSLSLPLLSVLLGFLDGFNPCAMWVLLFLISMLIGMENKKRRWILGMAFIVASAFVYFIFMAAWLNLILFLGFLVWVRLAIGGVALAGGGYSLKEFFTNKDAGCKVTGAENRQKIFQGIKTTVTENNFWLALGGIVVLAFMVNLVELICSAGLPAIFTQILALNNLAPWQYYFYIFVYIFFFMLDDLVVFFISMKTLEMTGITTKYTRASRLIGGILMLLIGLLIIFKPEVLMFG